VTSKLQLTVPKAVADQYGIRPGDEVDWIPAGDTIRVLPPSSARSAKHQRTIEKRLKLFDQSTDRLRQREAHPGEVQDVPDQPWKPHEIERGWRREDLYERGGSR
jgi:bifunctional DNA-binding transcriptional regulator/antitoxin component of YhaV-PrlF toxin-antitoxin module